MRRREAGRGPLLPLALLGLGAGALYLHHAGLGSSPAPQKGTRHVDEDSPNARLLAAVLAELPDPSSVLAPPDPRWDADLGGKKGPEVWGYYEEKRTADGHWQYGTTCGVWLASRMAAAKWPPECINRNPPEGSGFKIGDHIARIYQGAKRLGWILVPPGSPLAAKGVSGVGVADPFLLLPGDAYCGLRGGPNSEHVGCVVSVGEPNASGGIPVGTADGGQDCAVEGVIHQCAKRRARTLRGTSLESDTGKLQLAWIVRAT